ncbi:MAG: polyprenyl synthetase family protein [Ruminococcaceae bacterium]|nr:polyprenyl synthetase family protein [Oscillospiraceae bacterium]
MALVEKELSRAANLVEAELERWLSAKYSGDTVLAQAMRYSTLGGGKRIRAFLVLQFCRLFGGREETALPFAAAIEMVHAYSLIHDDLPCMDNDDMRRGKLSCHKAFGEANALLAGDTLLTQAFEVITLAPDVSDASKAAAVRVLANGAGALGMAGGQYYDLADECASYEELHRLHRMKTGALIRAAAHLGCYASDSSPSEEALSAAAAYAENVGFAFQIVDDLLDVRGDAVQLGKPVGSDARNDKKTILSYMTIENAETLAAQCTEEAKKALAAFENSELLCALADYLMNRKH